MSAAARDAVATVEALVGAARGGRVASSGFLPPREADAAIARLRAEGVGVSADGGVAGAERRIVTAHPAELPTAGPRLAAVRFPDAFDPDDLRAALRAAGIDGGALGDARVGDAGVSDARVGDEGVTIVTTAAALESVLAVRIGARPPVEASLATWPAARERTRAAVVPSLRVDALGARAFGVSRAYFAKGIAAGRVHVNGRTVSKSAEAAQGDEVWADGLGRFRVSAVHGETRRGNLKVTIEVEGG